MKRIINFFRYDNHNKKIYKEYHQIINENNYKRLIMFCFTGLVINLLLLILSIFNDNIFKNSSHLYLIMIFLSIAYLIILTFGFKNKNKKFITILFYIYTLLTLYCFETLDVNYNLNSTVALLCMIYIVSGYLFVDIPIRYFCITLIFTIWLSFDVMSLKTYDIALLDCINCFIACFLGACMNYYHFNERLSIVIAKSKVEKERDTDYLTGLSNRMVMESHATKHLNNINNKCAIIVIDLDDFKYINDTYGHDLGDTILRQTANVMKKNFRNNELVSRIGGDEFVIFIPNVSSKQSVEKKVEYLRKKISEIKIDNEKYLTCSIGVSFLKDVKNYDQLFKEADSAMYEAKQLNKNSFKIYEKKAKK